MRTVHVFFFVERKNTYSMKNIHIGAIIRQKLEESPLSIAEFASRINRTRTTVYDIFHRKSIDIDLLLSISEVLEYNFIEEVYVGKSNFTLPTPPTHQYTIDIEVDKQELRDPYQVVLNIRKK